MNRARIILANVHTTSTPSLVLPWLMGQATMRHAGAILLQEATPAHRKWLCRHCPRWTLTTDAHETILIRKHLAGPHAAATMDRTWHGKHTGDTHEPRTIPAAILDGWLHLVSVHFPPGWTDGPDDRQHAGREYRGGLSMALAVATSLNPGGVSLLGGDWNASPHEARLRIWRQHQHLTARGDTIDHVAIRGRARIDGHTNLRRGPGMDHNAHLYIVEER